MIVTHITTKVHQCCCCFPSNSTRQGYGWRWFRSWFDFSSFSSCCPHIFYTTFSANCLHPHSFALIPIPLPHIPSSHHTVVPSQSTSSSSLFPATFEARAVSACRSPSILSTRPSHFTEYMLLSQQSGEMYFPKVLPCRLKCEYLYMYTHGYDHICIICTHLKITSWYTEPSIVDNIHKVTITNVIS